MPCKKLHIHCAEQGHAAMPPIRKQSVEDGLFWDVWDLYGFSACAVPFILNCLLSVDDVSTLLSKLFPGRGPARLDGPL